MAVTASFYDPPSAGSLEKWTITGWLAWTLAIHSPKCLGFDR